MNLEKLFLVGLAFPIPRDNDTDTDTDGEQGGGDESGDGDGDKDAKFTQKQVNDIVVKRNKSLKAQYESLEKNYQDLLEDKNLGKETRAKLETDLENVQAQLRTREQQLAHEAKRASEQARKEIEQSANERDYYRQLFESETKERSVTDAATKHGAYNPKQFISILGDKTKIVEEVDESGEKTGRRVARVELTVKGEDGNPVTVLKTPEDAIEYLKEDVDSYGNLFRSNVARGIGEGTTAGGGGRVDATKMSDAEYFANRAAIKQHYGIRTKRSI